MTEKSNATIYNLGNGLRVAARRTHGNVSYIGVAVNTGSRDDPSDRPGMAHFVEHTLFKGTRKRHSWHISNRMESVGGELNAYTSKEETLLYTNAPAGYASRAVELLADIIGGSTFPENELLKEREVVIEEINSYLDSPADAVFDEYEELIYAGSAMAHNILGTPGSVRSMTGADCRNFVDSRYTPENMVIYVADPGDPEKIVKMIDRHFGSMHFGPCASRRVTPGDCEPFQLTRDRGGHQAHTIFGSRLFGRHDERRYALFLLNNYLGGPCMNSRLNQEIRERRGLAYTVDSNVSLFSDCGTFNIYVGSDPDTVGKCASIVAREIERLAGDPLPERTFARIREQYCGQLLVSSDNREAAAMSMAKSVLYYGEIHDAATMAEAIRAVTPEQLCEAARILGAKPLNRLTLQ